MQIKRFEAPDMTTALNKVKKEFGSNAVILSARSLEKEKGLLGHFKNPGVEITAATDPNVPTAKNNFIGHKGLQHNNARIDDSGYQKPYNRNNGINPFQRETTSFQGRHKRPKSMGNVYQKDNKLIFMLHKHMLSQGIEDTIALKLIEEINASSSPEYPITDKELKSSLVNILGKMGIRTDSIKQTTGKQNMVAFVGPTGVGKTTTITKLAAIHSIREKSRVGLITMDSHRLGAIEQLKVFTRIIDIPIETASNKHELKKSIKKLGDYDLVLIDTPGISPENGSGINEIKEYCACINSVDIHLLLSATIKDTDLVDICKKFNSIPVNKLLFTKIDETVSYGNIINQIIRTKIPVSYFTDSQQIPEGIKIASIESIVDMIIMQNRKTNHIRQGKTETLQNAENDNYTYRPEFRKYFIANINSDIFHCPDCKSVNKINPENFIVLESVLEALNKKLKPCRICSPDIVDDSQTYEKAKTERISGNY